MRIRCVGRGFVILWEICLYIKMEFNEPISGDRDELDLSHGVTLEEYRAWAAEHDHDPTQDPPHNRSGGRPTARISIEAQALVGQRITAAWREAILGDG